MKKVVLITGASSGLGKATANYLADQGYLVYGTSRNPDNYETPNKYQLIPLNLNKINTIQKGVDIVLKNEGRIDILINNAGTGIIGPIEELEMSAIHSNFETNLYGPLKLVQVILPQMRKQQNGFIINITSIACSIGLPYRGGYSASKGALSLLTEAIRMEVSPFGIKVCTVAPGDFVSDIASRRYYAPLKNESPYKKIYKKNLNTINKHIDSGINPQIIVKKILHILNSNNPKVHYSVGSPLQKFSVILKSILPSKLFEKLLMLFYTN